MNRRDFLKSSGLGGISLSLNPLFGAAAAATDWNVLVITSDEHNSKIMGCAGNPTIRTPSLDRLAREGTRFTCAYAADPICAPTRQSIMTGNYPQEHGQFGNSFVFNEHLRTWGDHFHDRGYLTACIGKTHTNNESARFGFDYRNVAGGGRGSGRSSDPRDQKDYEASPDTRFSGKILQTADQDHDGIVAQDSIRWLKENKDRKFFLHASFVKPHWPWDAPEEFYHMYDPARIDMPKMIPGDLDDDWAPRKIYDQWSWKKITEQMHRTYRARYYGSLSWMDHNIGRLLATVDELKLAGRTLVIYTTDHGDMAAEKGMWLKSVMFDGAARVPLIFRMPGVVPAGKTSAELFNHVDLFPTVATLAGAGTSLPQDITGRNFSQAVLGKGKGREMTFSVHGVRSATEPPQEIMVRSRRWKCNWYPNAPEAEQTVLYDMERDPDEIVNVAARAENKAVVAEHRRAIDDFLHGLKKPAYEPKQLKGERKHVPEGDDAPRKGRRKS
jgi:choline-sulfatase